MLTREPEHDRTLPASRTMARYPDPDRSTSLGELVQTLWDQQGRSWPALAEGLVALRASQVRTLSWNGTPFRVQFNPRRMVSNQSRVDRISVAQRACFLCLDHLPDVQQGIGYREDYLILCNPAPIFFRHMTVVHRSHLPQAWAPVLETMLTLARDLGSSYLVFYNGPACGASAPDHLHLQCCPAGSMPVEDQLSDPSIRGLCHRDSEASVCALQGLKRGALLVEGEDLAAVQSMLQRCLDQLRVATGVRDEPWVNVLCRPHQAGWQVVVFPRKAHRPSCYFLPPSERILISPGTVDMAGLIITPAERDFHALDETMLQTILEEVAYDDAMVHGVVTAL